MGGSSRALAAAAAVSIGFATAAGAATVFATAAGFALPPCPHSPATRVTTTSSANTTTTIVAFTYVLTTMPPAIGATPFGSAAKGPSKPAHARRSLPCSLSSVARMRSSASLRRDLTVAAGIPCARASSAAVKPSENRSSTVDRSGSCSSSTNRPTRCCIWARATSCSGDAPSSVAGTACSLRSRRARPRAVIRARFRATPPSHGRSGPSRLGGRAIATSYVSCTRSSAPPSPTSARARRVNHSVCARSSSAAGAEPAIPPILPLPSKVLPWQRQSSGCASDIGSPTMAIDVRRSRVESAGLIAADFNHDGDPDVAGVTFTPSSVHVGLGKGDGTFLADQAFTVADYPQYLQAADLIADGNIDLVTVNRNVQGSVPVGNLSELLGNGDGTFQTARTVSVGGEPTTVVAADFNGAGNLDLAVGNIGTATPQISLLKGHGDGSFDPEVMIGAGT